MLAFTEEIIALILMAIALGMDAFSVGLGMGMLSLRLKQIFIIGLTVGLFHVWMPLIGMIAGRFLSEQFGTLSTYAGGILLILLGGQMLFSLFKEEEFRSLEPVGSGLLLFSLSVSLDSLSVGLSLGIFGAKTAIAILLFGISATVLTWLGLILGRKIKGWLGKYSEALGGCILIGFGLRLLFSI